jgi:hypothetical protein
MNVVGARDAKDEKKATEQPSPTPNLLEVINVIWVDFESATPPRRLLASLTSYSAAVLASDTVAIRTSTVGSIQHPWCL